VPRIYTAVERFLWVILGVFFLVAGGFFYASLFVWGDQVDRRNPAAWVALVGSGMLAAVAFKIVLTGTGFRLARRPPDDGPRPN